MHQHSVRSDQHGFTLIEVLVSLLLLSLLAAAVFPVVTQRVSRGEPVKAAQHLGIIRAAVEDFTRDMRGAVPGDLEDLLAPVRMDEDLTIRRGDRLDAFRRTDSAHWRGPYIDSAMVDGGVLTTGFGVPIQDRFTRFDATNNAPYGSPGFDADGRSLFVAVQIGSAGKQLTPSQFEALNDLIDGAEEPDGPGAGTSWTQGRLRFDNSRVPADSIAYYLAAPVE